MLSSNPLKIAITGGSGFLGGHLLPILLKEDFQITCLSRNTGKTFPEKVNVIAGDCLDARSLEPFLEGQDVLIHMACSLFAPSWQSYLDANVRGTQNILSAIKNLPHEKRPGKVIHISSLAAAGPSAISPGLDEKAAPAPVSAYGWSKLFSEKLFQQELGDQLLIIRPPIIYGSKDKGLLPMFRSAKMGLGISPGINRDFPVSIIHADDVARAILLLLRKNARGIFHLNDGEEHSMASICRAMGKALGKKVRILHPPLPFMGASAALCSAWANISANMAKFLGRPLPKTPPWTLDKYREARQPGWLANAGKIKDEYNFIPEISLEKGMAEAVRDYRGTGLL